MAVVHTVLFGFQDTVTEAEVQRLIAELNSLPERIPEIQSWTLAEDVGRRNTSLRFALLATFGDLAALERYLQHPEHVAVVAKAFPLMNQVAEHDYLDG